MAVAKGAGLRLNHRPLFVCCWMSVKEAAAALWSALVVFACCRLFRASLRSAVGWSALKSELGPRNGAVARRRLKTYVTKSLTHRSWTHHCRIYDFWPFSIFWPRDTRSFAPTLWLTGSPAFDRPAPNLWRTSAKTKPSMSTTTPAGGDREDWANYNQSLINYSSASQY